MRRCWGARRASFFQLPAKTGFATVEPARLTVAREHDASLPVQSLDDIWAGGGIVRRAAQPRQWLGYKKRAERMVRSLLRDDRPSFRDLLSWAPLIETQAYLFGTRLIELLDLMRRRVLAAAATGDNSTNALAQKYLKATAMLGRASLVTTTPGASAWLVDMAHSFTWHSWTPGLAMTRERSLWLGFIGARAAAEFGPALVEDYLGALARAKHPVTALDAICGLAAIGLRHAECRKEVVRGLKKAELPAWSPVNGASPFASAGREQALELLQSSADSMMVTWSVPSFDQDPLLYTDPGGYPLLAGLRGALAAPAWSFIAPSSATLVGLFRAARMIARAWGPNALEEKATMH